MATLEQRMAKRAVQAIERFGAIVTFTREESVYDPDTGATTSTATSKKVKALLSPPSRLQAVDTGSRELQGFHVADYAPQVGERITLGSQSWRIVEIGSTYVGGTAVLHQLLAERA